MFYALEWGGLHAWKTGRNNGLVCSVHGMEGPGASASASASIRIGFVFRWGTTLIKWWGGSILTVHRGVRREVGRSIGKFVGTGGHCDGTASVRASLHFVFVFDKVLTSDSAQLFVCHFTPGTCGALVGVVG